VNQPQTGARSSRACCTLPWSRERRPIANSTVCHLYRLPFGINYALKLLYASGTSERLSLVFECVLCGGRAPS
jgi:hypothetical protein